MDRLDHRRWPSGEDDAPLVIGIAGGSGSGKTTVAHAVLGDIDAADVAFVEHDAYYRDRSDLTLEQRSELNYDHPDAFETGLLIQHVIDLRSGRPIPKPIYDFTTHSRTPETVTVEPASVIVVEGILVLVEPALRDLMDLKIFVDTDADIRLIRRLQRDVKERGRSVESVLEQYLATVRPMHLQFVEESKRYADLILPEGYNPGAVATVTSMIRDFLSRR
jgi:uridine kinase